jgi:hypothetical protein
MLLPAVEYGAYADVKKRMPSIVRRLVRGEGLIEVMTEGGMLDVAEHPGKLLFAGATRGPERNFHTGLPWLLLWQALLDRNTKAAPAISGAIFDASLEVAWGVLGLLSPDNTPWLIPETRFGPFLDAVIKVWDELDAVGPRYFSAVQDKPLWHVHNSLHYVLANMGVPHELLHTPLPPGGPRALLKYVRAAS